MRNIVLCLTYLGTAYHGWQVQKNLVTVAGTLEAAAGSGGGAPGSYDRLRPHGCGGSRPGVCGQFPHRFHHPLRPPALCPQYAPAAGCGGEPGPRCMRASTPLVLASANPIPTSFTMTGFETPLCGPSVVLFPPFR